jgi:hypothetical protein
LNEIGEGLSWTPRDPGGKWTSSLVNSASVDAISSLFHDEYFVDLEHWGDTTLGMVTGNNKYFMLSPQRADELGLGSDELLPMSPPGSAHLRGLSLTKRALSKLGEDGKSIYLFYPGQQPSAAASHYIEAGHKAGVDTAYKCRVRKTWFQVPLLPPADLLLTCMNADTPRLTANEAKVRHLNSVHGVYLRSQYRSLGRDILPLASLNSVSLLHAEMVGRAYGGGILKIEPKEADVWAMPSPALVSGCAEELRKVKRRVAMMLKNGKLLDAVEVVDQVLFKKCEGVSVSQIECMRKSRSDLSGRRNVRAGSGH